MYYVDNGSRVRIQFRLMGPSEQVRKRLSLLIQTDEGILHKIVVTCEDVDWFFGAVEKKGDNLIKTLDKGGSSID